MNQKLPGKTVVWVFMGVCVALVFIIGFGIGFGSAGGAGDLCQGAENCQEGGVRKRLIQVQTLRMPSQIPVYYFLANNSESCPELSGERLLTTVAEGESFEGLSVSGVTIMFLMQTVMMIILGRWLRRSITSVHF